MIESSAISRYQRVSAKKINRILELIRGKPVPEALNTLTFLRKQRTKIFVLKTLKSAVANAIYKSGKARLKEEDLYVKEATCDHGPSLKRFRAGPRGMPLFYKHRTSHIKIKVQTKE
ncbi:MAG: uL22 family ribosomal protein [candidate division WOR-3 bacterium]